MKRKRTIVITGADRGLGYELAKQYLERGDRVFAGKFRTRWTLLQDLEQQYPGQLDVVELDVSSTDSVRAACSQILAKTDRIDILINNAGVWLSENSGTILEDSFDYEKMMIEFNINALGALRVTQALIHTILNSFDRLVVNVSSEAASITGCYKISEPGYCMSKAAMNMQSCIVLNGIKRYGGAVLNLHPGSMQSVISKPHYADAEMIPLPEDTRFYVTAAETAEAFIRIIDEPERFASDKPGFVNYRGDVMKY
jgi:NAD(P)-dependent dehydrogenase (short-subunit alcohol dehydrogenase family)